MRVRGGRSHRFPIQEPHLNMTVNCDTAGEVFFTIPATKMATDNQLQRIANLQVVWYTSAITTIFPTLDYLQRLQRGMVESKLQEEKVNDNDLAKIPTGMSIVSCR